MKSYIKKIGFLCLALILLGPAPYATVWARGGGGGGGHGGGGHGGGGHFGGGHGGGGWGGHHGGGHWGGHHRGWGYAPYGLGLGLGLGYGLGYYGGYGWGWGWGGPYYGWGWGGGYYPPNYGYSAAIPSAPPVYVQRQDIEPSAPRSTNYWYYCRNPEGYYPYVKECAEGWLQVAPQPSAQQ